MGDALYEKVRVDGRIVSMAVLIVCGVDGNGHRDIIAVEPMVGESKSSYGVLFQNLKDRGLSTPRLIISCLLYTSCGRNRQQPSEFDFVL